MIQASYVDKEEVNPQKLFTSLIHATLGVLLLFISSCQKIGEIKSEDGFFGNQFLNIVLPSITVQEGSPSNIVILFQVQFPKILI